MILFWSVFACVPQKVWNNKHQTGHRRYSCGMRLREKGSDGFLFIYLDFFFFFSFFGAGGGVGGVYLDFLFTMDIY